MAGNKTDLWLKNARCARQIWGELSKNSLHILADLTRTYSFSVRAGHLRLMDGRWYITHSALLELAARRRCNGITTSLQERHCNAASNRWVFKAVVHKSRSSKGFVGYGDADPSNISALMHGAEMRIAETRAVNRALRKAYGIGLCSVEELGSLGGGPNSVIEKTQSATHLDQRGSNNGQPKLRDRLCVLIRQHNLDPTLVKAYAADFCGVPTLRDTGRDLVESFVSHLATAARENRDALICKLNSYAQPAEVKV